MGGKYEKEKPARSKRQLEREIVRGYEKLLLKTTKKQTENGLNYKNYLPGLREKFPTHYYLAKK